MITQHLPIALPVILLAGALVVALVGSWKPRVAAGMSIAVVAVAFAMALAAVHHVVTEGTARYVLGGWLPLNGIEYVLDPLSAFMAAIAMGIGTTVIVHSRTVVRREVSLHGAIYYSLVLLLLAGFSGIVLTGDMFNLYVFLEISSLSGYALIAVGEKPSPFAAFRYLIIGTIGASFYLLGLGFVYVMAGSLNLGDIGRVAPLLLGEPSMIIGLVLMFTGVSIKMALFPLHSWLPDAYTYAPSTTSALIAPLGTKVAAYVLIRILFFAFDVNNESAGAPVMDALLWLSAGGILFGSVMAFAQNELKRMLAYSSISQIGYIGLGIGLANPLGLIGALLHVLYHAMMKSTLFLVAANMRMSVGHSDVTRMDRSLPRILPWTMAGFCVAALSMVGVPPLGGFFSKWYLVLAAIESSNWVAVTVVLVGSLLTAAYFFRVLEAMYLKGPPRGKESPEGLRPERFTSSLALPVIILAVLLLAAGLANNSIVTTLLVNIVPQIND